MRREIKFRGKRRSNAEWVYGLPEYTSGGSIGRIEGWTEDGDDSIGSFFTVEVVDESIGQFTGLKDKNGKEIYEGDILKLDYPINYGFAGFGSLLITVIIEFNDGCFWFTGEGYTDCNWHFYNDYEVIGNRYENPELL
jgi:uncharacterized phage protein (TIGR01671 family)